MLNSIRWCICVAAVLSIHRPYTGFAQETGAVEAAEAEVVVEEKPVFTQVLGGVTNTILEEVVMKVCATSPIPDGWIKIDDIYDPTACGSPQSQRWNVVLIAKYKDMSIGTILAVYAGQKVPTGWVEINQVWDPSGCGRPAVRRSNVSVLKRVQ